VAEADADFLEDLRRWVADARADEAGAARSRLRALRLQAEEDATFAGLLLDEAERGGEVVVTTVAGALHAGTVAAVGRDFAVVWVRRRLPVFVPLAAVASVRLPPGASGRFTGDRPPPLDAGLAAVLGAVAGGRPRVRVAPASTATTGVLAAVGTDVCLVHADGEPPVPTYVPMPAVTDLAVLDLA
jgi:hypothetical protein